jgi:UDP-N-acetylmuramyl pentapeptide phosphotransferase/UDP-N-acetylglucosamine-1-phosphate transferase
MDNPAVMYWRPDCLLLSYTFLIVPAYDVIRVSIMRMRHHTPIFSADKNHIHHKLMRAGLSQHQALAAILGFAIFYIAFNLLMAQVAPTEAVVVLDIVIWMMFHAVVNHFIVRKGNQVFAEN